MSSLLSGNRGRGFTACWLLLYAVAGLLVHSSLGHNHWHGTIALGPGSHAAQSVAQEHSHAGDRHDCPFHRHARSTGHSHAAVDHACEATCNHQHTGHNHSHHDHSDDEDCAGCKLLGSMSAPAQAVLLAESGRLITAAPLLEVSLSPVAVAGLHLARAPPVA